MALSHTVSCDCASCVVRRKGLTPAAERIITALREKPEVLFEVAQHFANGWPTIDLVGPWEITYVEGHVLVRLAFDPKELPHTRNTGAALAAIRRFVQNGHDGSQWEAGVFCWNDEEDVHQRGRIFDDIPSAAAWADSVLRDEGLCIVPRSPSQELIATFLALSTDDDESDEESDTAASVEAAAEIPATSVVEDIPF